MKVKFTICPGSYSYRLIWSRFNSHSCDIKLISHSTKHINCVTKCILVYSRNLSCCTSIVTVKQSVTSNNSIWFCRLNPGQGYSWTVRISGWHINRRQRYRCTRSWKNKDNVIIDKIMGGQGYSWTVRIAGWHINRRQRYRCTRSWKNKDNVIIDKIMGGMWIE